MTRLIPDYSPQQMRDGYLTMMARFNQEGITAIKDPGIGASNWKIYSELRDQKKLTIHLFPLFGLAGPHWPRPGRPLNRF